MLDEKIKDSRGVDVTTKGPDEKEIPLTPRAAYLRMLDRVGAMDGFNALENYRVTEAVKTTTGLDGLTPVQKAYLKRTAWNVIIYNANVQGYLISILE